MKPLHAQAPTSSEVVFQRGLRALQDGDAQTAASAFEAAYTLDKRPLALLNLGIAYTNLGRIDDAITTLESYVQTADPTSDARNIAAVRAELARLRAARTPAPARAAPQVSTPPAPPPPAAVSAEPAATAPAKAAAKAPAKAAAKPTEAAPSEALCALGGSCLGPTLDLGLPNAIGGGFHVRIGDYFGVGIDFQVLPSLTIDVATASASLFSVNGRIYPFGGSFFLAGGFAYQAIRGRVDNGQLAAEAKVGMPAFFAGLGFMGHDGLVVGVDLGVIFPLAGTAIDVADLSGAPDGSSITQAQIDQVRADAKRGVKDILDLLPVLLQLNLARIGYLF